MKEKISDALNEFNTYHGHEARLKLVSFDKDTIKVAFVGHFCHTCGYHDYFDDLKVILEEKGIKAKKATVAETENGAIVTFRVQ